jgi:predicted metalloendopeptidase
LKWQVLIGKTLTEPLNKDKRREALQTVNAAVGEALGKLYVEKKFLKPKKRQRR